MLIKRQTRPGGHIPTYTVAATCPCAAPPCGQPLTCTFDHEGNLIRVSGPCAHASAYGSMTQPEAETDAIVSAALRAATEALAPPPRTADTMSDAIALSSPSGHMSRRARAAADTRLGAALFGPRGLQPTPTPQPTPKERLLHQAQALRDLAARGMSARRFIKEAERLEAAAAALRPRTRAEQDARDQIAGEIRRLRRKP